jgi:hypothetical protein
MIILIILALIIINVITVNLMCRINGWSYTIGDLLMSIIFPISWILLIIIIPIWYIIDYVYSSFTQEISLDFRFWRKND